MAKSEKREPDKQAKDRVDMETTFKTVTKTVSPDSVSFGACCGRRFDLLGLATAKMKTLPQSREIIVVTCTAGAAQSKSKKSTYFVCPGSIPVPALKKLKRGLRRHNSPQDDLKVFPRGKKSEQDVLPSTVTVNCCRAKSYPGHGSGLRALGFRV